MMQQRRVIDLRIDRQDIHTYLPYGQVAGLGGFFTWVGGCRFEDVVHEDGFVVEVGVDAVFEGLRVEGSVEGGLFL